MSRSHATRLHLNAAVEIVHEQASHRGERHSGSHQRHHHTQEGQHKHEEAIVQAKFRVGLTERLLVEEKGDRAPLRHRCRSNKQPQQQRNRNQQELTHLIHTLVIAADALLSPLLTEHITKHLLGRIRSTRRYALVRASLILRILLTRGGQNIRMANRVGHGSPQRHSHHKGGHYKHHGLHKNLGGKNGAIAQLIKPQPVRIHLGQSHKCGNQNRNNHNRHQ